MSPRFDGRTALVTDGTGEVGRATALGFARAGAAVVAVHRGDDAGAAEDGWDPARCFIVRADPATAEGRAAVLAAVHDRLGGTLDVLVANHATYDPAPLASLPAEAIAESMQANLTSHLQLTRARILSTIPLRRFVTPTEVANTVLFLAGEEAGAVSGATVRVDGGG